MNWFPAHPRLSKNQRKEDSAHEIAAGITRILLGLIFFVFGLNGFLNFIPVPPLAGVAGAFVGSSARTLSIW